MHELSIAQAIVGVMLEQADGRRVRRVGVVVGHLRQVVPSALTFSFELVTRDTVAEGAALELREVAAAGVCRECRTETEQATFPLLCGTCGSADLRITRGEELRVEWMDVESADEMEPERSGRSR